MCLIVDVGSLSKEQVPDATTLLRFRHLLEKYNINELLFDDSVVYVDSGYIGIEKREEIRQDEHLNQIDYRINCRPSQNRITSTYMGDNYDKIIEQQKPSSMVGGIFLRSRKDFYIYNGKDSCSGKFLIRREACV